MENITTGHWIFAGIFMTLFIGYLLWGYRKDLKLHKIHYNGSFYVLGGIIVIIFLFYVFGRLI
ncbi:MAG: hypothetical protein DA405_06900 [Bacteroidetes bacterium]|jgi:hypothetical protein|nr:MAG: hypothetical protein DA405_06900 [Bacteroidota bacterium]|tara:strand:- start:1242 stop:1430 length:189 start_codon:yes stop_codon:yes gene_type:complete